MEQPKDQKKKKMKSLKERIRERAAKMQEKVKRYPNYLKMIEETGEAFLAYGVHLSFEHLTFLSVLHESVQAGDKLAIEDVGRLTAMWDHTREVIQSRKKR